MIPHEQFMIAVRSLIGTPLVYRGRSANGLDCSGLLHVAYNLCGVFPDLPPHYGTLPSTTDLEYGMLQHAKKVNALFNGAVAQIFVGGQARHLGVVDGIEVGSLMWIHADPHSRRVVRDVLPVKKIYAIWQLNEVSW